MKDTFLQLLTNYNIKVVDVNENELEELVEKYIAENIVPDEFINDARHVGYATIMRVDILVSFNLKHIANEWSSRRFNSVNLKEGYPELTIRTPEEVIHYEE